jgi:MFS family permease
MPPVARNDCRFSLGSLFIVFVTWPWMNTLLKEWGYRPYRGWGIVIGLGIILGFALVAWLIDYALAVGGVSKAIRSGLWLGAVLGPYAGLLVVDKGGDPQWGHLAGIAATMVGFALGYPVERLLARRKR